MSALLRAELLKLRTTRAWIGFLVLPSSRCPESARRRRWDTASDLELGSADPLARRDLDLASRRFIAFLIGITLVTDRVAARDDRPNVPRDAAPRARAGGEGARRACSSASRSRSSRSLVVLAIAVIWLEIDGCLARDRRRASLELVGACAALRRPLGRPGSRCRRRVQSQTRRARRRDLWILVVEGLVGRAARPRRLRARRRLPARPRARVVRRDGAERRGLSRGSAAPSASAGSSCSALAGYLRIARRDMT